MSKRLTLRHVTKTAGFHGEKNKFFFRAVSFSLFSLFLSSSFLHAEIRQWEFEKSEDYQFDQKKIELKDGSAKLLTAVPYRDAGAQSFQNGEFNLYTTSERGTLELAFPPLQETSVPELPNPVGNREHGLSALWHFDEPSGTNILDVAGRTIAKGSDAEVVSGQTGFGFARLLDGEKSYIFIPHYETLRFDGAFTLEAWIRPIEVKRGKPQTIISRWQTVGAQRGFALQISPSGKINFLVSPEGSTTVEQTGETILSDGVWHHVAAVYNGSDLRIYVNGILDGKPLPFSGPVYTSNNPIYLGALVDNRMDQFYKGVIDETAVYRRALSETEILAHFGNLQGLAGLWHFNERGGVLADQSGYAQNGTAFGDVQYEAEGKIGTALSFRGKNAYVEMPASSRFAPNGQMHLEAWVKPETLPGLGQTATVLSIYEEGASKGSTGSEFSLALTGPEGRVMAYAPKLQPAQAQGKIALMPGVWQHIAVSWGQGVVRIYNNGILDTAIPYTGSLDFSKMVLRVGSDSKNTSSFKGSIDEVAVYRRPRTEQEIAWTAGLFMPGGTYTSDVKDAGSVSPWKSVSWKLPLDYGRETPASETGLLHAYSLNDAEGASIVNSRGEIQASPIGTYPVPGVFGRARWFSAKGYDKILTQKDFPALSTFTVSTWFQFAQAQPGLSDRLFSIGDGNPTVFRGPDGKIHVQMPGAREIIGQRIISDAAWHHLALAADGQTLFLYIDGLLDGNSPLMTATAPQPLVLGNLKSSDTFRGALDEFLFYNYSLDRDAIMRQFLRGKMDVQMLVRSSDDPHFSNSQWRGPNGVRWAEDAGAYTAGLWHFDETLYKGEAGEVRDSGRFAGHGSVFGKILTSPSAVYGNALDLNGSTDFVRVPDSEGLHMNRFTLSAWVRPEQTAQGTVTILDKQFKGGAPVFSSFALELLEGSRLAARAGRPGGYLQVESGRDGEVGAGHWNFVAATFDGKEIRLYINGKLVKTADFHETIPYDDGPLYFGRYGTSETRFFGGQIDEVQLLNAAASEQELQTKFLLGSDENYFRPFEAVNPGVSPARYFQYQVRMNTQVPFASPAVSEINLQSNPYPADKPAVTILNGISYADLTGFAERTGKKHSGNVTYQLSPDGANWFFSNGRHWIVAAGANESNTAQQIQNRIHDFAKEVGIGSFYFRAFLNSPTGAEPVELDAVEVEYLPNKLTVTAPNGGEAILTGSEQIIRWNSAGEVSKVNIEYSKDDFKKDFHEIARGVANTGSYTWKVPDDLSVQVRVRVLDALNPKIYDISDLGFRVTGKIEVTSPNWNERWEVGTQQEIKWKTLGNIQNVKIEYSTDDFTKNIFPIVDSYKNEGSYKWNLPDHVSKNVKVRVSDVRDLQVFDISNDTFAVAGKLTVLSPDLSARWLVGSTQEIRWLTTGTLPLIHIDYQTSKSPEWIRIAENFQNTGTYMWKIPDIIDGQVQIRLRDAGDSKVVGDSTAFAIIGGLRLLNPRGGEQWTAGTRRKIAWESIGTIPTVDIEYRTGLNEEWQVLEKALANTGEYIWEVPASIIGPVTVRVLDSHDATVQAVHAASSSIIPGFHLRAPNGGENWKIGTEQNIVWDTTGDAPQVRIEYSKDRFVNDVREVIASASNLGSFTWVVPDDAALEAWVRVSDASNPTAQASSDAPFRIFGAFDIEIPKGGEKFEAGSLATFVWQTTGTVPEVKIEYSHDDFHKDARLIESALPNEGRYTWKVPDDLGDGYQVRISDVRDEKTESYSEGHFSVMGNFHLTYPAGGEDLIAGTLSKITWTGFGSAPVIRIDYSEDDFQKSFNTLADKAPNTGSYEWTIPNLIGRKFKLRIWDPSQPDSMDTMQVPARIVGGFRLLEPNGGELLFVGERYPIKWETSGTLPRVKLEFSPDNFTKEISAIADSYPNSGVYEWLVPNAPSAKYRVRISDPGDVTAYDISNSDFTVRSHFALIEPNGGEAWPVGSKQIIRWQTTASVSQIKLEYSTNDFAAARVIEKAVPNTGEYEWTVPDDAAPNVKIRVSDVDDSEAMDISDETFRIQGVLNLTSPVGKEVWKIGEQRAITWQTTGKVEGVRLDYSRDGFSSESKVIIESTPNTGFYNWIVPDDLTALTKVRVMDVTDHAVQSVSPLPFEIIGGFVVLGPNGGEVWHATEKREINWLTVGSVKDVTLYYSTDDFKKDVQIIERGIMNTGRFEWEVPSGLGDNYKVRVCDADNTNACDASDNIFAVRTPIELTYPKGGEKWTVASNQEIRWNSYGSVPRVSVFYSVKPGEWKKMAEELPNEGRFLFRAPDHISNTVLFKVVNDENSGLEDVTREPVSILGTFDLISPNGGEKWAAGTSQKITWDTLGTVSNARLEYSIDDFKNDINLIESSYTNTGSYLWTVPEKTGVTMKVRILDADHPQSLDVSNDVFKIMPGFTLAAPNGGEKWTAGKTEKIVWKTAGKTDWVRLEYQNRAAIEPAVSEASAIIGPMPKPASLEPEWILIAERIPNGGEYSWTLPKQTGREFKVRVTDALDADAGDVSDDFFEVKPELVLNRPIGGEQFKVGSESEILWDTVGTLPFVKIEYSTDGFQKDIRLIAAKTENTGKFLWQTPDHITADARVRVTNFEDPSVVSSSPRPFKILPVFDVLVPAGLEQWTVGTDQEIKWNWQGSLENVKLEYSLNDFSSSAVIQAAAPNKGSYIWQVPDLAHALVRVRVSSPDHSEAFGISQAFKVIPGFEIVRPNGGEKFKAGERQSLEWKTAGSSTKIKLEYGVLNGEEWTWKPIENVLRNQGKYEWRVPEELAAQMKIRVTDAMDTAARDESDRAFKVIGVFNVLSPRADEILKVDGRHEIRWETTGKVPSVKLEYSLTPEIVNSYKPIENLWNNSGKYFWTVPDSVSEQVWLKVSDPAEPEAFAVTEKPFKIRPVLKWDMPVEAGGFIWAIDSVQTLKWNTLGTVSKINLEYTTDRKNWKSIAMGIPNSGNYGWKIPDDTAQGVQLRVTAAELTIVSDTTETPLTIAAQFELLTPKAGDIFVPGSRQAVTWKTTGRVQKVWLEFMTDGKKWQPLAGPMPDAGNFEWTVPDQISSEVKVRIFDGSNAVAQAVSSAFQIKGALNLTFPRGAEILETGSRHTIQWQTTGTIPKVKIEAIEDVLNEGEPAKSFVIADNVQNKGSFEWTVPDQISNGWRVRVTDVRDNSVFTRSDAPFAVIAAFEMKSPKENDVWIVGSSHEIVWSTAGTVPEVSLEYSRDEFYRDINLIANHVPNTGAAIWQVADTISPQVKIRVSDARDPRAAAVSDNFKVRGALALSAPESGSIWTVGSVQNIAWQTVGSIASIRLEYSRDDFRRDINVIENVRENNGGLEWTVPDVITGTLKLRVSDEKDPAVFAVSAPVKVRGALKLKYPLGGEKFQALSSQKIGWDTTGTISRVRLEYSKDDFNKDVHVLAADQANQGAFDWIIPDDIADTLKVRVLDAQDFSVVSVSPESFSVRGSLAFTTPTAGARWSVGSEQGITWETIGTIPQVRLEYSKDDFQKDIRLIAEKTANRGKLFWTVPDDISGSVRLRVVDLEHGEISSVTTEPASIVGQLAWTSFNKPGVNVQVGQAAQLTWESSGTIPVVRLEYADAENAGPQDWKLITGSLENKGGFSWIVPDFIRDRAVLRVSDARDPLTSHVSQPFAIRGGLGMALPSGGERWIVGSTHDLVWNTAGSVSDVVLEYSTDAFRKNVRTITPQPVSNTGRFQWTVPDSISEQVQVRVRDAKNLEISGASNPFSISGDLSFINPSGPAAWQMGVPQTLQWQSLGTIPFVRLEYMAADVPEGEERGSIIISRLENKGGFQWDIPADAPAKIKLRISNADDSTVFAETPEPVRIFGVLSFTAPAGKQIWTVAAQQDILWNTRGVVPNVKLEYSRDRFMNDIQTIYPLLPNTGTVSWQVPDAISPEVWLRVSDADNPSVFALTAEPLAIKGAFKIVSPQDGQPTQVSAKQEIVWQTLGSVPFVNLEYSNDLFHSNRTPIAQKVANTGHYFWDVPDAAREKLSVRVSDASDMDVFAVSRPFGVHGGLSLISPRGGEIWKVDQSVEIQWKTLGKVPFVKLEYSSDEFSTSDMIAARADNKGIFVWHVPSAVNKPIKIKISDADDSQVFSVTGTPVKVQSVLSVLAPQGGEFWLAGSEQPVIWQSLGSLPYVNLEYSSDNFNTAVPVMMGMANQGRHNFMVPDLATDTLRFRVTDARDQSVMAVSNPIRVGGRISILSPSGNDILKVGEDEVIQWRTTGTIPKVKIDFSGDGFKKDIRFIQEAVDNAGVYTWKVPDTISRDLQLRVSDAAHPDIYDVTAAPFKISGGLEITAPRAGETWAVSSRKSLEWETKGTIPFVRVEYSKDNFYSAIPVDLNMRNTGKMEWQVPDFSGEQIQFRVSDASDASVSDTTPFRIAVHGVLSLKSPVGGEVWKAKTQQTIAWNTIGTVPNVTLSYFAGNSEQPVKIAEAAANTGSYIWNLPDQGSRAVKVRVADSKNPFVYSESPVFEIQGTLALTAPQGGEVWLIGTQHPITWNSAGSIEKVRLEYTADNFGTVVPIALSLPNEGRFLWRVPDAISRSVQVRLSDAAEPSVFSESRPFEIRGSLALINPLGGEDWAVGSRHPISWQTTGTIPQVRLEYSTDDFQSDIQLIAPGLINKGVYYWDIPTLNAQQLKIRVMDTANPDVFDVTRNPVRLAGALNLTLPNQGESYRVGEKIKIRWTGTANIANVKLEYSADNFKTATLISNYVPNNGSFDWNIPDRISDNMRIRVSDSANSIVAAASQIPFKIQGAFRFISPKGSEIWNVGSRQILSWETLGSIPKVRLEYSTDRFKTAIPIAAALDNQGRFDWAVPDLQEREIEFRISDASAPSVQAVTAGRIEIMSSIEVISPSGGERWIVGEEKILRWRTLGGMSKVNLEYSKDNFNKNIELIAADLPNLGSYSWKVPHDLSKEIRIRVKGASDSKIAAVSEPFAVDLNRVTWSIRDLRTNEHLIGLTLTDSTGKTQKNLSSPLSFEYPYGIYTTVWSKPGYAEFRNTWLADKDLNFTVTMTPEEKPVEAVRFDFRYDSERDLMSIKSWYDQNGSPLSAVVQSEVRIYKGTELIKTLISSTPDTEGYFNMVWDTRQVAGNSRYTASASITAASGQIFAGPVSYQLDIPVKELKEPALRQSVSSIYLKPIEPSSSAGKVTQLLGASPLNSKQASEPVPAIQPKIDAREEEAAEESFESDEAEEVEEAAEEAETQPAAPSRLSPYTFTDRFETVLTAPNEAVVNETISVHFTGGEGSNPVLDLYDSNRKLVLRAQEMESEGDGKFSYLLPIKGLSFIPGKSVTVTVVDLSSGSFKSASIMIKSATTALGLDREAGAMSAQQVLLDLEKLIASVQSFQKNSQKWERSLSEVEEGLSKLAGSLTQSNLPPVVLQKFNDLTQAMAQLLQSKGYDSQFLLKTPIRESDSGDINARLQLLREAAGMLRRLYQATAGGT